MNLATCPPDILRLILSADVSYLIVRLWKCGNRDFNARLALNITEVRLAAFVGLQIKSPPMLHELHKLRSVAISAIHPTMLDLKLWSQTLGTLPKTLQSLSLLAYDANEVFHENNSMQRVRPLKTDDEQEPTTYVDLSGYLPNLTSLQSTGRFEVNFFASLPSLTSLSLENSTFELPFMSKLPRSLTYLKLDIEVRVDATKNEDPYSSLRDLLNMPPHCLESSDLTLAISFKSESQDNDWTSLLPKSVTDLSLRGQIRFTPSVAALLPRSLAALSLARIHHYFWRPFRASYFSVESKSNGSESIWPPALTSLTARMECLIPGMLASLPRTCTSLALKFVFGGEDAQNPELIASELPPHIRELTLEVSAYSGALLRVQGPWPTSLTALGCNNCQQLSPDFFVNLPSSATELEFALVPIDMPWKLPPNIRKLTTDDWNVNEQGALPSSLTDLNLVNCLAIDSFRLVEIAAALPTSLTSFKFWSGNKYVLSPRSFANLKSLRTLHLPFSVKVSVDILNGFPKSLTTLHFNGGDVPVSALPLNLLNCGLGYRFKPTIQAAEEWPLRTRVPYQMLNMPELMKVIRQRLNALNY